MKRSIFDEYLKTVDFECLKIELSRRQKNCKGNTIRVTPSNMTMEYTDEKRKYTQSFTPSVCFLVDYWENGYHLFFGFRDTVLGKRYLGSDGRSCRITKKFNDQVCFNVVMMALFIAFDESGDSKLSDIKKFPDLRLVTEFLPKKFWKIFDLIKKEFPLALDQKIAQSLYRIREEFKILHKYDVDFKRVTQTWNESMVSNVMDG